MVSGQTVGILGVGIGTVFVVIGNATAGMVVMILGIGGAVVAEAMGSGQDQRRPR